MMYAIGKGVQQDYREAGKWFLTAAEAGNTRAAINYVGSLRSGMGNLRRDPELSERWAKFLIAHPEYSPVPGPVTGACGCCPWLARPRAPPEDSVGSPAMLGVPLVLERMNQPSKLKPRKSLCSDWDLELLGPELEELKSLDFDLSLIGFDDREIDDFLADPDLDDRANTVPAVLDIRGVSRSSSKTRPTDRLLSKCSRTRSLELFQ
jgi:hypothetical protein